MQDWIPAMDIMTETMLASDDIKNIPVGILLPPQIFKHLFETSKKEYVYYLFSKINAIGAYCKVLYEHWNDVEEEYEYMFEKIANWLSPHTFKHSVFEKIVANKFEYVGKNHVFWREILNKIEKMYENCNFGEFIDYKDIVESISSFKIEDGDNSKKYFFANKIN